MPVSSAFGIRALLAMSLPGLSWLRQGDTGRESLVTSRAQEQHDRGRSTKLTTTSAVYETTKAIVHSEGLESLVGIGAAHRSIGMLSSSIASALRWADRGFRWPAGAGA